MQTANVTIKTQNEIILWNQVNWSEVNAKVNNLRQRIYRASAAGDLKKVRSLQKLMLNSTSNKLSAIRRVTQVNQGRKTPGVDKIVVNTEAERNELLKEINLNQKPKVSPIKRVYIPKKNGKLRPLGLPTILDRCRQVVVKSALEPYWEAKFEKSSYGFRPGRSAHDAMQKIFCIVRPGKTRHWALDADIKGAFDNISHEYLMKTLGNFPARSWINSWLKSGIMENNQLSPTTTGTPQGGIASPLLANIALHGMEDALGITYDYLGRIQPKSEYALVRYADDFVIFAKTKTSCESARTIISKWLKTRGLELSEEKTHICHIDEGFDFLGFNVRHYKTRARKRGKVFLCKPSKASIKSFKKQMKIEWKRSLMWRTDRVIANLNPKIKGWCNYFRTGASKETFSKLDKWMFLRQKKFVIRRHPNKFWWWRVKQYWGAIYGRQDRWVFMDKKNEKSTYLWKLAWTPIKRHTLIKSGASPDNPEQREYWRNRQAKNSKYLFKQRGILWYRQQGLCPICNDKLDNGEPIHIHHKLPRRDGGNDNIDNLAMLHGNCHRQVHSKRGQQLANVRKLLEPCAG